MIIRHNFGIARARTGSVAQATLPLKRTKTDKQISVLMVGFGENASIVGAINDPVSISSLSFSLFLRLELSGLLGANIIVSPLLSAECDAHDCAEHLVEIGFNGKYRAVVDRLPDAKLVMDEIHLEFPELDFQISETNPFKIARLGG